MLSSTACPDNSGKSRLDGKTFLHISIFFLLVTQICFAQWVQMNEPCGGPVTTLAINSAGNEIETLVNEEKPVGTYELTWNAEGLPSEVYLYQLKAGDFIETNKMLLLKKNILKSITRRT